MSHNKLQGEGLHYKNPILNPYSDFLARIKQKDNAVPTDLY